MKIIAIIGFGALSLVIGTMVKISGGSNALSVIIGAATFIICGIVIYVLGRESDRINGGTK